MQELWSRPCRKLAGVAADHHAGVDPWRGDAEGAQIGAASSARSAVPASAFTSVARAASASAADSASSA